MLDSSKLNQTAFNVIVALIVGAVFAHVLGLNSYGILYVVPAVSVAYLVSKDVSVLYINIGITIVISGVGISVLERAGILVQLNLLAIFFVVTLFLVSVINAERFGNLRSNRGSTISQLVVLIIGLVLIRRLSIDTPLKQFAFLTYEDNAAWISTAARSSSIHSAGYVRGFGGFSLDPLMALLNCLVDSDTAISSPLNIYRTTTFAYLLLEFLAITAAGLFVLRFISHKPNRLILSTSAASGCIALCYVALQLPRSTGHLTFIGAILFIWLILLLSTLNIQSMNFFHVVNTALLVGALGMWWPFILVVAIMLIASSAQISRNSFQRVISYKRKPLLAAITLLIFGLGLSLITPIFTESLSSLSIRQFLTTSGGVQPVPGQLILVGVIGLFIYTAAVRESAQRLAGVSPILALGILVIVLQIASNFVGPDFLPHYSFLKTLLLFSIATIPLIMSAVLNLISDRNIKEGAVIALLSAYAIGSFTVGWDLNNPRNLAAPTWSASLQSLSVSSPGSLILCTTSDPTRNLEAYLCSRHAAALQNENNRLAEAWRYLVINPSQSLEGNTQLALELKAAIDLALLEGQRINLLSFESMYQVAEEDLWWMSQLPVKEFQIAE